MPVVKIGSGSLDIGNSKTIRDLVVFLRDNRDKAKELGVNDIIQDVIVAEVNGAMSDLSVPVVEGADIVFLTANSEKGLDALRHSAAHVMAQAVQRLYPGSKFGIGPAIKDGFYYDIDLPNPIHEEDLPKIEAEMEKIVEESVFFQRKEISKKEALELFNKSNQIYKTELISELEDGTISVYQQGDFTDLCRGPHIPSTRQLKAFKLLSMSGAYWRGNEKNAMLTRIYGTAFADKKALKAYLEMLDEAKKRDHRKLGKELDLFHIEDHSPGQIFWHPKGALVYNMLKNHVREKISKLGYLEVITPELVDKSLLQKSGHIENYSENIFMTRDEQGSHLLKPMNCPCHILIYNQGLKSWRDLPLRIAEFGKCHRNELAGTMHGLMRVRGFVQDDAHIFCTEDQIAGEVKDFCALVKDIYADFGFEVSQVKFSTRPEKRIGSDELWDKAEKALSDATDAAGLKTTLNPGEGAFYGPKLEFVLKDCLGRDWQCGTIQVDFNLPVRLDAFYVGQDNQKHNPVMLHRAALGSIERFFGVLLEHYAGKFPLWLSPVQVSILPVSDKFNDYAHKVAEEFAAASIRAEIDLSSEKLGYKIRKAQMEKVPYMLVVGEKEVEASAISVRHREKGDLGSMKTGEFLKNILEENRNKV
jgi:threonyl-tRNA synthetase